MYGFVPSLPLGCEPTVERLEILDAHVHLNFLSPVTESSGDDGRGAGGQGLNNGRWVRAVVWVRTKQAEGLARSIAC